MSAASDRSLPVCWLPAALALVLVAGIVPRFSAHSVWDDAYMFVRYADNLLLHGAIAWNGEAAPTFGPTSLLYLLAVVVPIRAAAGAEPALAALLSSFACGALFLVLLWALLRRPTDRGKLFHVAGASLVLICMGVAIEPLGSHFVSGMDTTLALAAVTLYALLLRRRDGEPGRRGAVVVGAVGGLLYAVRPELLLYAGLVPVVVMVLDRRAAARRDGLWMLGVTLGLVAAQMGLALAYFGSALPLSFYAKGTRLYGEAIQARYRDVPWTEFRAFVGAYWPLLLLAVAGPLTGPRRWWRRSSAADKGLMLATVCFYVYFLGFVLQIMYYSQRFYYPTLPVLALLAIRSAAEQASRLRGARLARADRGLVAPQAPLVFAAACVLVLVQTSLVVRGLPEQAWRSFARLSLDREYDEFWRGYWFRLDRFSRLPDDLVIAATEVGRPAALNPAKTILDLTGLNETAIARRGFSTDILFEHYRPDLIYMPHPDYRDIASAIVADERFRQGYHLVPGPRLGARLGLALRRDSRHYREMLAVLEGP